MKLFAKFAALTKLKVLIVFFLLCLTLHPNKTLGQEQISAADQKIYREGFDAGYERALVDCRQGTAKGDCGRTFFAFAPIEQNRNSAVTSMAAPAPIGPGYPPIIQGNPYVLQVNPSALPGSPYVIMPMDGSEASKRMMELMRQNNGNMELNTLEGISPSPAQGE